MVTFRPLLALGLATLAVPTGVFGVGTSASVGGDGVAESVTAHVSNHALQQVDTIELGAEAMVLEHDDSEVVTLPMRDARGTVAVLNRLLGTPARSRTHVGEGGACFPAGTTYTWGGGLRVAALNTPSALGNAVEIRVLRDDVRGRTGTRIALTGPDGVQVGDDIAEQVADAPPADRESFGSGDDDGPSAWQLLLAPGWNGSGDDERSTRDEPSDGTSDGHSDDPSGDDAATTGRNGLSALTDDDSRVIVLGTPMPVNATRDC